MVACGPLCLSLVLLVMVQQTLCAPRSKNNGKVPQTQTIYDQKQTGDYNIQFHLKDFQIIALVADDASLGDYDYSYDYADFTVKPSTQKPSEPPSTAAASSTPSTPSSTLSPLLSTTGRPYVFFTSEELPKERPSSSPPPVKEEINSTSVSTAETPSVTQKTAKLEDSLVSSPGKIKVQIVEAPGSVVPGEDVQNDSGDASPPRKCAAGFTRDKRGRCRRVRKPATGSTQLFGFSRLASNLASRFNQHNPDTSPSSPSSSSLEPIVE